MVFVNENGEEMSRENAIETKNGLIVYTDGDGHWYLQYPEDKKGRIACNDFQLISFMSALVLNGGNIDDAHEKVWG